VAKMSSFFGGTGIAGFERLEGFCDWAWNDIHKIVAVLLSGENFSREHFFLACIENLRFLNAG